MRRFPVSADKEYSLLLRMQGLGIREEDIDERFIRGSGSGGQKINKTSSCVQLLHRPSGLEVRCQRERSQALNRFIARRMLCDKIEARLLGAASKQEQAHEKIRRQKRRRTRRGKEKMLEAKKQRGKIKKLRGKVGD